MIEIAEKLDRIIELLSRPAISADKVLWDASTAGASLGVRAHQVSEHYALLVGLPDAIRLPSAGFTNQSDSSMKADRILRPGDSECIQIALAAVRLYAETHPRPSQVTQTQAAEILGLSRPTVAKLIRAGTLKLNRCGLIQITEVDRMLQSREE